MAMVVYLKPGEAMLADQNCVLVRRDLKGSFTVSRLTEGEALPAYLLQTNLGRDVSMAIERAGALADGIGVETVLVATARAADQTPIQPWLGRSGAAFAST